MPAWTRIEVYEVEIVITKCKQLQGLVNSPDIADRFAVHRASPHITTEEYLRSRVIELGKWVTARDRIYLDTRFWIYLRNSRIGASCPTGTLDLLEALTSGVSAGRLVCPISDALFIELMKQSDPTTRFATSDLIDELSCGISLCNQSTRVATEVAHFMHANSGHSVHQLEHLVWTKVSYVLGVQLPVATEFSLVDRRVMQKSLFDYFWDLPLSTMVRTIGTAWPTFSSFADIADRLNRANALHYPSMKSFAHVYRDEINGAMEIAAQDATDVLIDMANSKLGRGVDLTTAERDRTARQCLGLLREVIKKPAGRQALRTLQVVALLHAALRWNHTQKLDANDILDFQHAAAGLGYCHALFTDGPMHALLKQRHLGIEHDFPVRVISSVMEATAWVRQRFS